MPAPGHTPGSVVVFLALPSGKRYALLVVLGYSRLMWLQFCTRQTMAVLMGGLEEAFTFFGGVPGELLFDQMKSVIIEDERAVGGKLAGSLVRNGHDVWVRDLDAALVDEFVARPAVSKIEGGHNLLQTLLNRHPLPVMIAAPGIGFLIHRMGRTRARAGPRQGRSGVLRSGPMLKRL